MDLKIAVVCSSNQNRSMEAHSFLRYFTCEYLNNSCTCMAIVTHSQLVTITRSAGDRTDGTATKGADGTASKCNAHLSCLSRR